jgi:hypothetical protein
MKYTLFVLMTALLVGCGVFSPKSTPTPQPTPTPLPCYVQAEEYVSKLKPIMTSWDDANKLANSTGRGSLSGPVARLQEIKQDVDALTPPECAQVVQDEMLAYMSDTIDEYIAFMGQKDATQKSLSESASKHLDAWANEYIKILPPTP